MTQAVKTVPGDIGNVLRRLRAVRLLALLLPVAVTCGLALLTYGDALDAATTRADRASRIAAEHALRLFDTNQMLLMRMQDMVARRSDAELRRDDAELSARLSQMAADLPQVQGLFINGADSRPIANSRVYPVAQGLDYSDREWYRVHSTGRGPALFVSDQLTSKITGEAFFDMSRRRTDAQGRFAGTVHVSLRPEFLTQFYARLGESEPGLRVTLLRDDGRLLARWPRADGPAAIAPTHPFVASMRSGVAEGRIHGASPLDGRERVGAFRRLDPYPLYALASIDRATVMQAWGERVLAVGTACMGFGLLLAWLAHTALGRTQREIEAAGKLHAESERRARAEASLVQSQRLETLGRLVGGVAHDFNNVLAIVSSHAMLLRRVNGAEMRERSLAAVERAVATGSRLTQQLLAVTRRRAPRHEVVELQERLPAVAELLRPVFGPGVAVQVVVAPGTRAIEADVGELEVALINLGINARDAMPDGGRFELRARNAVPADDPPSGDGFVLVEAADSGLGMDAQTMAQAFEPFFTTKAPGKGTGLGLSQVQALCAACHGAARIRSQPGAGTTVSLFLGVAGPQPQARPAQPCVLFVRPAGGADDVLQSALRAAGCDVLAVDDARMARALLSGRHPQVDFALVDTDGHGARGAEAWIRRLRRQRPGLPVLAASSLPAERQAGLAQADLVLRKPCAGGMVESAVAFARRVAAETSAS